MEENLKKHFLELYQMILSDLEVHPEELELFYQLGKARGFSEQEIQKAVFSPNKFVSSESLSDDEKITYLYNLAQIAWVDGKLDKREKEILRSASKRFGFAEEYVVGISDFLLSQAENNKSIEEVLQTIKNL